MSPPLNSTPSTRQSRRLPRNSRPRPSAVGVAEQQVSLRRVELADTTLRAPFDGVVISKDAQPGEMVSPTSAGGGFTRTGVCTIVDMSSLEIEVDVNEAHIGRIFSKQPVAVVLDAYPEQRIPGHVVATVPAADRQKATVQIRIAVDQLDPHMLPDMTVKVSFLQETDQKPTTLDVAVATPRAARCCSLGQRGGHRLCRTRRSGGAPPGEAWHPGSVIVWKFGRDSMLVIGS